MRNVGGSRIPRIQAGRSRSNRRAVATAPPDRAAPWLPCAILDYFRRQNLPGPRNLRPILRPVEDPRDFRRGVPSSDTRRCTEARGMPILAARPCGCFRVLDAESPSAPRIPPKSLWRRAEPPVGYRVRSAHKCAPGFQRAAYATGSPFGMQKPLDPIADFLLREKLPTPEGIFTGPALPEPQPPLERP
jgi:hypothetical protein